MAHPDRARLLLRRPRRRHALPATGKQPALPAFRHQRVLMLPVVDRMLGRALGRPRLLQWLGALAGLALVALALWPLFVPSASSAVVAQSAPVSGSATALEATPSHDTEQAEIVAVVAAYNQASITAALLGHANVMAPYLAPDGTAWAEVQAEFARRATRAETHEPTLTRWGVLREEITGDTANVETQEQWDDITSVAGEVISSRRGLLTHNTYELRRAATSGRWQITTVTSVSVIG